MGWTGILITVFSIVVRMVVTLGFIPGGIDEEAYCKIPCKTHRSIQINLKNCAGWMKETEQSLWISHVKVKNIHAAEGHTTCFMRIPKNLRRSSNLVVLWILGWGGKWGREMG